jgi:hypothetical protein
MLFTSRFVEVCYEEVDWEKQIIQCEEKIAVGGWKMQEEAQEELCQSSNKAP